MNSVRKRKSRAFWQRIEGGGSRGKLLNVDRMWRVIPGVNGEPKQERRRNVSHYKVRVNAKPLKEKAVAGNGKKKQGEF